MVHNAQNDTKSFLEMSYKSKTGAAVISLLGLGENDRVTTGSTAAETTIARTGQDKEVAKTRTTKFHIASGQFRSVRGETGEVSFGVVFAFPPRVLLSVPSFDTKLGGNRVLEKTIVMETTTVGYRWKNAAREAPASTDEPTRGVDGINSLAASPPPLDWELAWEAHGDIEDRP